MELLIRYEPVEFETMPINVYVTKEREVVFHDRIVMPVALNVEYEHRVYELDGEVHDWKEEGF